MGGTASGRLFYGYETTSLMGLFLVYGIVSSTSGLCELTYLGIDY